LVGLSLRNVYPYVLCPRKSIFVSKKIYRCAENHAALLPVGWLDDALAMTVLASESKTLLTVTGGSVGLAITTCALFPPQFEFGFDWPSHARFINGHQFIVLIAI
jgi:hypothetical protein